MKSFPTLRRIRSTAAETLAEVIIATVVLATGGLAASTLVTMAINANAYAEERIVAYNLAREGVEAIRNVRDTSWLRFPGEKDDCWDTIYAERASDCNTSDKFGSFTYTASLVPDDFFVWQIMKEGDTGYDETLYLHSVGASLIANHDPVDGDPTKYSRSITITKDTDSMEVLSTVTWDFKGDTKSVMFSDELTNY